MGDLGDQNTRLKTFTGTTDVKEFIKRFNIVIAAKGVVDESNMEPGIFNWTRHGLL